MDLEETNGANCRVIGINYRQLSSSLSKLPGVHFPNQPNYFWSGLGVYTEFVLQGHTFQIEADPFEDAMWISAKDNLDHREEIHSICNHLKNSRITTES